MIEKFVAGAVAVGIATLIFAMVAGARAANVPDECVAKNAVEHMICGDSQLMGLKKAYDHTLAGFGPGAEEAVIGKAKLSSLQTCDYVECAREWFTDRISELLSLRKITTEDMKWFSDDVTGRCKGNFDNPDCPRLFALRSVYDAELRIRGWCKRGLNMAELRWVSGRCDR